MLAVGGGIAFLTHTYGKRHGYYLRESHDEILADLKAGTPPTVLAGRHGGSWAVLSGNDLVVYSTLYKRLGVGPFRDSPDDPPFILVPVAGVELPLGLGDPDHDKQPYPVVRELKFPTPPSGAFAVRCRTTVVRPDGWQQLTCRWTDTVTGERKKSIAHPNWMPLTNHLVFTFDGRPNDLTVSGATGLVRFETVEWLVVP